MITSKENLTSGSFYMATIHSREHLTKVLTQDSTFTFECIVRVWGDPPFLRLSGWDHGAPRLLTHEECLSLTFGDKL